MIATTDRHFYTVTVGARYVHVALTDHEADEFRAIAKDYAWLSIESL